MLESLITKYENPRAQNKTFCCQAFWAIAFLVGINYQISSLPTLIRDIIVIVQRLSSSGYVFSASLPPYLASAAITALDILEENPDLITKLKKNISELCKGLSYFFVWFEYSFSMYPFCVVIVAS